MSIPEILIEAPQQEPTQDLLPEHKEFHQAELSLVPRPVEPVLALHLVVEVRQAELSPVLRLVAEAHQAELSLVLHLVAEVRQVGQALVAKVHQVEEGKFN